MTETWRDRLSTIGQALLTLEINTVVTSGLSAQKMPEVPLALHTLVQVYGDYLAAAGFQVTQGLLAKALMRVEGTGDASTKEGAAALLRELQSWPFAPRRLTIAERKSGLEPPGEANQDITGPVAEPTNGAEMFEALQWAAWAALQTIRAGGSWPTNNDTAVISRINANCRQLKEAARRLEQQHGPRSGPEHTRGRQTLMQRFKEQMPGGAAPGAAAEPGATMPRLFAATVEQTARALFNHPRPVFNVDPDVTVLIRKAWDIGVERVCLQTVMQMDGDMLQVIGDMQKSERDFLTKLHQSAVTDGVGQWHALLDLVRQLAGAVGSVVFRA
jgi:hypothetical protein